MWISCLETLSRTNQIVIIGQPHWCGIVPYLIWTNCQPPWSEKMTANFKLVKTLYSSLVRSGLEFCSLIWNPWQINLVEKVERVKKKFIKYLCYKQNIYYYSSNYVELCKFFKLPPLFHRRKVSDLCFLYKCIHSVVILFLSDTNPSKCSPQSKV